MPRFFNTAGPCLPDRHYMLPPEQRLTPVRPLIDQALFFVVHAPRQTGKTTLLNSLARSLDQEGRYTALVSSVEHLRSATDVYRGNLSLIQRLHEDSHATLPEAERAPDPAAFSADPLSALHAFLRAWTAACPKPIVLFVDEIDSLPQDLLLNVLGQLRMGYNGRASVPFLHSVALVGLRDVRDYRIRLRPDSATLGTSSPFNIKSDSVTLRNFTRDEVAELYGQHTAETGQVFTPEAIDRVWEQTEGQPWLTNALARQITEQDVPDRAQPITSAHVDAARETLILRRDTHLDSLVDKLQEERVRWVIEPVLAGAVLMPEVMNDDMLYVRDLGLIATEPHVRIANPIYAEIIPRALTYVLQRTIPQEASWYTRPDGSLDMRALLRAFQAFFAEHSEAWLGRFDYHEAGPHLVLMAFLQRVINGGGTLQREFAVGSGRVDLLVTWRGQRHALELKIHRNERTLRQGIDQLSRYLDRLGLAEGTLVLFDRRPDVGWDDKLYERELDAPGGKRIVVFGA